MPSLFLVLSLLHSASALAFGDLFLIGGGTRTPEIISRIGEAAGGTRAKILVIPWATRDPESAVELLRTQFETFKPKWIRVATGDKNKFLSDLRAATAIYMTGGSQNRIMDVVDKEPELKTAIQKFYARGGLYIGTSAGTAAVPSLMMNCSVVTVPDGTEMAVVVSGLGLLPPGIFIDQHFIQRARYDRLRNLILQDRANIGVGVSESTAVIIHDSGVFDVIGESKVGIYFFEQSGETPLREVWLARGDRFSLRTRSLKINTRFR